MNEEFRVVEVYQQGEKVYKGKAWRLGWIVYRKMEDGYWVRHEYLPEGKKEKGGK